MSDPVDPTAGTWHDQAPAVAAAAAEDLRVGATDPDRDRLELHARAACRQIDQRLQLLPATGRFQYTVAPGFDVVTYGSEQAPEDVTTAAVQLTQELYRRKDAPFGVLNAWTAAGDAVRIGRDQLAGVDSLLAPYVEGWGLA